MNYEQAIQYLLDLPRKNKGEDLSCFKEQIEKDLEFLFSNRRPHFFHVTGTNGKGSVVGYLGSLLVGQGYKVGIYQSPHVYDIRERILINGEMLSEDYFVSLVEKNVGKYDSWSEYLIAMALRCFLEEKCDVVVWEVGVGGRFDPTNIIEHSMCCLTSIGFDHVEVLGDSLLDIAWQKIGILKSGSGLVIGCVPEEVVGVIQEEVDYVGGSVWWLGREIKVKENQIDYPTRSYKDLFFREGPCQIDNLAIALGILEKEDWIKYPSQVNSCVNNIALRGRWEKRTVRGVNWILDGAHNRDAGVMMVEYMKNLNKKWIILGSSSFNHDPKDFFKGFVSIVDKFFWVNLLDRGWQGTVPNFFSERFTDMGAAVRCVEQEARKNNATVLVTGSFYLLGEINRYLTK